MRPLLLLAALAAGCAPDAPTDPVTDAPRFLALGDSYTVGEGVRPEDAWPARVAARLRAEGVAVADPEVVAVTGWTTDELDAGIDAADPRGPFDLVTLLVGVNDQYRGHDIGETRTRYRALLRRAVAFAGGDPARVVAVSVPDWGRTPFAAQSPSGGAAGDEHGRSREQIAAEIDALNAAERAEAEAAGVAWVDVTALSRLQGDAVVADGLHPNASAYAAWAERIASAARAALGA